MTNEEIETYIKTRCQKICQNMVWFEGEVYDGFRLALTSILENLLEAGAIKRWEFKNLYVDLNEDVRYMVQHRLLVDVDICWNTESSSVLDLNKYQVHLVYRVEDRRPIGSTRRRPRSRWDMIAEEIQCELPFNKEKQQQKDRANPRDYIIHGDVPTGLPPER